MPRSPASRSEVANAPQGGGPQAQPPRPGYEFVDLAGLPGIPCPCGTARRALADVPDFPGTIHLTSITVDAQRHYHRTLTEVYVILECSDDAQMEVDGEVLAVRPRQAVLIRPGTRHRALGAMTVLIVCLPKFDPADEWLD
jgi:mannose-6-phosphate isomerase-like protein (cupin superfamily)